MSEPKVWELLCFIEDAESDPEQVESIREVKAALKRLAGEMRVRNKDLSWWAANAYQWCADALGVPKDKAEAA